MNRSGHKPERCPSRFIRHRRCAAADGCLGGRPERDESLQRSRSLRRHRGRRRRAGRAQPARAGQSRRWPGDVRDRCRSPLATTTRLERHPPGRSAGRAKAPRRAHPCVNARGSERSRIAAGGEDRSRIRRWRWVSTAACLRACGLPAPTRPRPPALTRRGGPAGIGARRPADDLYRAERIIDLRIQSASSDSGVDQHRLARDGDSLVGRPFEQQPRRSARARVLEVAARASIAAAPRTPDPVVPPRHVEPAHEEEVVAPLDELVEPVRRLAEIRPRGTAPS